MQFEEETTLTILSLIIAIPIVFCLMVYFICQLVVIRK